MQQSRSWAWRLATGAPLVAGLMAVTAGSVAAVPDYLWRDGWFTFTRAHAPVYARSVDGWACHLFWSCRSAERGPDDPPSA